MSFERIFLVAVVLISITAEAMAERPWGRETEQGRIAADSCDLVAAIYVSNAERLHPQIDLPATIQACSKHPDPSFCRFIADTITQVRGFTPLSCPGQ